MKSKEMLHILLSFYYRCRRILRFNFWTSTSLTYRNFLFGCISPSFPGNFTQPRERVYVRDCEERIFVSRFLTNSPSYGVGWLRETGADFGEARADGYIPQYRRDVTYLRGKKSAQREESSARTCRFLLGDDSRGYIREANLPEH